ncbi:B12-binding domain-containing radical SAM protein [Anaerocolumna xylanovorans]|uniref:Radical SAM superfamily enzyme YgiQ, UPF0313 family n=1 Tax=Anaerocolumna xylanovorans DSM 12503 TaxID=1121345 RepID=A0A1M7Y6H8_9FIRM|nr:B12-binding domain-containing radical SAM protein [Anaerocolumna xylanovorans]SHO48265.1 Radical SAM superfamily enzyme YgiQ, UPF0313 family [Anaerocolumna xylanovorans DSM 12503]
MKILLVGINAKYIHSNLAIRSLRSYASDYMESIDLAEYTINQYTDDILMDIYRKKPDFIGFSCYLWNLGMVKKLCRELRKILPDVLLWLGGPEVSYDPEEILKELDCANGIMCGEGEETFHELLCYYMEKKGSLRDIKGICFRSRERSRAFPDNESVESDELIRTSVRQEMDMNALPFPYEELKDLENKIIYYESCRGCPYSCSYCLSSERKKVRFRDLDKVKEELSIFLKAKVPQVKFVDRTFNCNHGHAMAIWQFLKENDNGITNFHFEIAGELLREDELGLLKTLREGLIQLEIGVQSANEVTLGAIHRVMSLEKIKEVVAKIQEGRNIHVHLDLIAGLPYEDYASFRTSFNEVYAMKPDQLQLGFLKVLKGSSLYGEKDLWGIVYQDEPPYEVLYTNWISYDEILLLKKIESMVEGYYNSGQFEYSLQYLMKFFETPFDLLLELSGYYEEQGLFLLNSSRMGRYDALLSFFLKYEKGKIEEERLAEEAEVLKCLMVHDLYLREKLKSRPSFAEDFESYKKRYQAFYQDRDRLFGYLKEERSTEEIKGRLHIEHYPFDLKESAEKGRAVRRDYYILYDYKHRNPLNKQAEQMIIDL